MHHKINVIVVSLFKQNFLRWSYQMRGRTKWLHLLCSCTQQWNGSLQGSCQLVALSAEHETHVLDYDKICWRVTHLQQELFLFVIDASPLSKIALLTIRSGNRRQSQSLWEWFDGFRRQTGDGCVEKEMRLFAIAHQIVVLCANLYPTIEIKNMEWTY